MTQCTSETSNSVKNVRHPSSPNAVYISLAWVAHTCPKVLSWGLRQPDIIAGKKQIKIYFSSSEYGNHSIGPVFAARVLVSSAWPFTSTLWLLSFSFYTYCHTLSRGLWAGVDQFDHLSQRLAFRWSTFLKTFVDIVAVNVKSNQGE